MPPPSPLDERVAGIIGEKFISGIVCEEEGDTDAGPNGSSATAPGLSDVPPSLPGPNGSSATAPGLSDVPPSLPGSSGSSATAPGLSDVPPSLPGSSGSSATAPGLSNVPPSLPGSSGSSATAPGPIDVPPFLPGSSDHTNPPHGPVTSASVHFNAGLQSQKEIIDAIGLTDRCCCRCGEPGRSARNCPTQAPHTRALRRSVPTPGSTVSLVRLASSWGAGTPTNVWLAMETGEQTGMRGREVVDCPEAGVHTRGEARCPGGKESAPPLCRNRL
ncbi:unnamed protein product [Arctogadus glacialis]